MSQNQKLWKYRLFLTIGAVLILSSLCFVWTRVSTGAPKEFAAADDFPRGALVYAQFQDLPQLLKLWNASALKQKYLDSQNFAEFQNRHLALKLISRWQEFNRALRFEADAATLATVAENRAAVAVYDIGKLEFVFIAPLSNEKFAATMFFQKQTQFEKTTLPDGTIYYSREVKADRGRQQQTIFFANVRGRFVLATSEDLLLRAVANINGKTLKDRLSDEPVFSTLAAQTAPHLATVWVDQMKLNEDWYFKHYWISQNVAQLKEIRAGIFDFEMTASKFVERRMFLLDESAATELNVPTAESAYLQTMIPAEAAFFKINSFAGKEGARAANQVLDTILDKAAEKTARKRSPRWNSYDSFSYDDSIDSIDSIDSADSADSYGFSYYGSDFDENINENKSVADDAVAPGNLPPANPAAGLEQILAAADVSATVSIAAPQVLANPLFVEFRRATILNLRSPANFNQMSFETAVSEVVQNRLGVAGANLNLAWETKTDNEKTWRELELPALGWSLNYALRENALIVANNRELLKSVLDTKNEQTEPALFDELAVIRLNQRKNAFDGVMQKIEMKKTVAKETVQTDAKATDAENIANDDKESDFFTGNIGSLLDTIEDVDRIEIGKNRRADVLVEQISFVLK